MTLQLLHSEFPYMYEENLIFFFISAAADLEANDGVVLIGEDPELKQQLVQLHHRLAVLLRERTGKKSNICVSAHCSEYHHRLAVLLCQRTGKKKQYLYISAHCSEYHHRLAELLSQRTGKKKQYLYHSAHCSEYHHRLAVLLRQRTGKKIISVYQCAPNIITVPLVSLCSTCQREKV
jgi:hypothetical protein